MTPLTSWKCKLRDFLLTDNVKLIKMSTVKSYLYRKASVKRPIFGMNMNVSTCPLRLLWINLNHIITAIL